MLLRWALVATLCLLPSCVCGPEGAGDAGLDGGTGGGTGGDGGQPAGRCEATLDRFFTQRPGTTSARVITDAAQLIGGPNAQGRLGDYLLENDTARFVVQAGGRVFGPLPWAGTVLDADLKHAGPGNDQFGEMGLLYNFGRTSKPIAYEVLADGSGGGSAVLAVTGLDERNDYLSIRNQLALSLGRVPVADPYVALPLRITTYYLLNPGETRLRLVTAFCSESLTQTVRLAVGDLTDPGAVLEFFNPQACTNGFGSGGLCFGLDRMSWYGYQGQGIAYGYAPLRPGTATVPEGQNAVLTVAGITGSVVGTNGLTGLFTWVDPTIPQRPGELILPPRGSQLFVRDFFVGEDLGAVATAIERSRSALTGAALGAVSGTVTAGGVAVPNARVVFEGVNGRTVLVSAADGRYAGELSPGSYQASAWARFHSPTPKVAVLVAASSPATQPFALTPPRRLTVTVKEPSGAPLPAKVSVLCVGGPCAVPPRALILYSDTLKDPLPDFLQDIAYVGASGAATLLLSPGLYDVLVSRGPEYSVFPNTYPQVPGQRVDLSAGDGAVDATLARVLDTTGWMSADFHVHAVNSPDSIVDNVTRVTSFAAEGVDILVSTDHDVVTDFGPVIAAAGLSPFLATVVGEEASPMEFGHYNFFPISRDASDAITGGALDWAGADRPTLTVAEIFAAGRARGARTVHFNHPRGAQGGFSLLGVDLDTLATHADAALLGMSPQPGATPSDTKLLSSDFNALEVLNSAEDGFNAESDAAHANFNDWFTLLSRGFPVTATGVSDTHYGRLTAGWRTYVDLGVDAPGQVVPLAVSTQLNAQKAFVTNGPFLRVSAYRVDGTGAQVTAAVGPGGLVTPDTRELGVTVEVQVPQYLDVTRIELFLHRPEDDAACPIPPTSPKAMTARVGCDGKPNSNWPAAGIAATRVVALTAGDLETAASSGGVTYRRYRRRESFRLPAPTTDNWLVAMVFGTRSLAPLGWAPPSSSGASAPTKPFAVSNPVFIDADGNGYDTPPFSATSPSPGGPRRKAAAPEPPRDEAEAWQRWGALWEAH